MRINRRESFDEWRLGRVSIQFFEPKLWRLAWPKLMKVTQDFQVYWPGTDAAVGFKTIETGWVLALPTMAIARKLPKPPQPSPSVAPR